MKNQLFSILAAIVTALVSGWKSTAEKPSHHPPPIVAVQPGEVILDGAIACKVVGAVDGDDIDNLLPDDTQQRIRIADGIATDIGGSGGQPFGMQAKQYVSELCFAKTIKVVQTARHFDRWIAYLLLSNGELLQLGLLRDGLAWHARKYSDDLAPEDASRAARVGIYSQPNPIDPSDWRKRELNE